MKDPYWDVHRDLKDAGYETAIAGKWHVAAHNKEYNAWSKQYGPAQRGFQWTANTTGARADKAETPDTPAYPVDELTEKSIDLAQEQKYVFLSLYYFEFE